MVEGAVTEGLYISSRWQKLNINSSKYYFNIISGPVQQPRRLLDIANDKAKEQHIEKVFCIFDEDDEHEDMKHVLCNAKKNQKVVIVPSVPCIEIWFYFHISKYSTAPQKDRKKLQKQVAKHFGHEKIDNFKNSVNDHIDELIQYENEAINNARQIETYHKKVSELPSTMRECDNPSSKMYAVIEYLKNLSE